MTNDNPIIGILSQMPTPSVVNSITNLKDCSSFIAASYVKYIESSGARVVPIFIGQNKEYYEKVLSKINGVLLTGGAEWFTEKNGFAVAGKHIYEFAKKVNDEGVYFPIFGICLGFELLLYLSAFGEEHRDNCKNLGYARNAKFKEDYKSSKMFENVPDHVFESFSKKSVANYSHKFCETEEKLKELELKMDHRWKVLMTGEDSEGKKFINAVESEKYPFYGVQFHPEKSIFEWRSEYICHSVDAIQANRYFGDFFISESRKNNQKYENKEDESSSLIYNHEIVYMGEECKFEQCYVFRHKLTEN